MPIGILAFFVGKIEAIAGVRATVIFAVVLIVLLSFLAGFVAKTRLAKRMTTQLEGKLLGRIHAYGLIKSMSTDLLGAD